LATDLTDPVVLLTIAQTLILTLTMVVFILSFRSQNEAIRDSSYQKALDDYTSAMSMLVQRPQLAKMLDEGMGEMANRTPVSNEEEGALFGFMLLNYSLFERIYLLYAKKWIDDDTWQQWHAWLKIMAKHPMFKEVHRRSVGTFDRGFQDIVDKACA
jgi:hypothetical protein